MKLKWISALVLGTTPFIAVACGVTKTVNGVTNEVNKTIDEQPKQPQVKMEFNEVPATEEQLNKLDFSKFQLHNLNQDPSVFLPKLLGGELNDQYNIVYVQALLKDIANFIDFDRDKILLNSEFDLDHNDTEFQNKLNTFAKNGNLDLEDIKLRIVNAVPLPTYDSSININKEFYDNFLSRKSDVYFKFKSFSRKNTLKETTEKLIQLQNYIKSNNKNPGDDWQIVLYVNEGKNDRIDFRDYIYSEKNDYLIKGVEYHSFDASAVHNSTILEQIKNFNYSNTTPIPENHRATATQLQELNLDSINLTNPSNNITNSELLSNEFKKNLLSGRYNYQYLVAQIKIQFNKPLEFFGFDEHRVQKIKQAYTPINSGFSSQYYDPNQWHKEIYKRYKSYLQAFEKYLYDENNFDLLGIPKILPDKLTLEEFNARFSDDSANETIDLYLNASNFNNFNFIASYLKKLQDLNKLRHDDNRPEFSISLVINSK